MVVLVVALILIALSVAAKLSPWKSVRITDTLTLDRLATVVLVLTSVGLAGWLLGYLGSGASGAPHITYADLASLGPIATALTAVAAVIGVAVTVWQKNSTDAREAWWKRSEWALSWAYGDESKDPARVRIGKAALRYQQRSRLAQREEQGFLLACVGDVVDKVQKAVSEAGTSGDVVLVLKQESPDGNASADQKVGEGNG
jgi:hypothetical protein